MLKRKIDKLESLIKVYSISIVGSPKIKNGVCYLTVKRGETEAKVQIKEILLDDIQSLRRWTSSLVDFMNKLSHYKSNH